MQVVAFILIGVAVYGRASALVTNLPIIGGILACGVILFLISILGLIGAVKHHQVLLFFVSFSSFYDTSFVKFVNEDQNSDFIYYYDYYKFVKRTFIHCQHFFSWILKFFIVMFALLLLSLIMSNMFFFIKRLISNDSRYKNGCMLP